MWYKWLFLYQAIAFASQDHNSMAILYYRYCNFNLIAFSKITTKTSKICCSDDLKTYGHELTLLHTCEQCRPLWNGWWKPPPAILKGPAYSEGSCSLWKIMQHAEIPQGLCFILLMAGKVLVPNLTDPIRSMIHFMQICYPKNLTLIENENCLHVYIQNTALQLCPPTHKVHCVPSGMLHFCHLTKT